MSSEQAPLDAATQLRRRHRGTPSSDRSWRVVVALLLLGVLGAVLLVIGLRRTTSAAPAPLPYTAGSSAVEGQLRLSAPLPHPRVGGVATVPTWQRGMRPLAIRIPALGVTAAIGTASVDAGVLTPPREPDVVGAWAGSAALDARTGEVTLAGHVNWAGMAPFAFGRLADLAPGDLIYTTDHSGAQSAWRVQSVRARSKSQGIDPAAFAGRRGPRMLTLITCGGKFDASAASYEANVYVTARPATT